MLIAEDLLLLLLDDDDGSLRGAASIQTVLGGAVLAELALLERAEVGERTGFWHTAKVRAIDSPPEDPLLAAAHAQIAEKERSAQDLVARLGKDLQDELTERLVGRGILRRDDDRVLGLFPRTRWPAVDSTHEDGVRRALEATLLQGADPDPRTASVIALLVAVGELANTVDRGPLSRGDLRKRAKAVAEGEWAARGVADAIAATNAAVMAAITASTTAATTATN